MNNKKINLVIVGGIRTHYIKIHAFQQMLAVLDKNLVSNFNYIYIDAGQHYDDILSNDFIRELDIQFQYRINYKDKKEGYLWGRMLQELSELYDEINFNWPIGYILVFGDVITTAIASLAAIFKHYKIVHIESGVRVKHSNTVEEKCRIMVDHLSTIRFTSNIGDLEHLVAEGIGKNSFFSGDIIYDYIKNIGIISHRRRIIYKVEAQDLEFDLEQNYVLISIHHAENQNVDILRNVFEIFSKTTYKAFFILHPVIRRLIEENQLKADNIVLADHIDYKSNLLVIQNAKYILTDSGGIQREAFYLNKRCIVCSTLTVWETILGTGNNMVVENSVQDILKGIEWAENNESIDCKYNYMFGDGNAVHNILRLIREVDKNEAFFY